MATNYKFVIRIAKILIVFYSALYGLLIAFGNITDYNSNFQFVANVMSMSDTFPENNLMYRAITSNFAHNLFYIFLIISEATFGLLCLIGGFKMLKSIALDADNFNKSKIFAIYGLLLAITIFFAGFQFVGSEWFGMWMSKKWNGLLAAFRLTTAFSIFFIILIKKDEDL